MTSPVALFHCHVPAYYHEGLHCSCFIYFSSIDLLPFKLASKFSWRKTLGPIFETLKEQRLRFYAVVPLSKTVQPRITASSTIWVGTGWWGSFLYLKISSPKRSFYLGISSSRHGSKFDGLGMTGIKRLPSVVCKNSCVLFPKMMRLTSSTTWNKRYLSLGSLIWETGQGLGISFFAFSISRSCLQLSRAYSSSMEFDGLREQRQKIGEPHGEVLKKITYNCRYTGSDDICNEWFDSISCLPWKACR